MRRCKCKCINLFFFRLAFLGVITSWFPTPYRGPGLCITLSKAPSTFQATISLATKLITPQTSVTQNPNSFYRLSGSIVSLLTLWPLWKRSCPPYFQQSYFVIRFLEESYCSFRPSSTLSFFWLVATLLSLLCSRLWPKIFSLKLQVDHPDNLMLTRPK